MIAGEFADGDVVVGTVCAYRAAVGDDAFGTNAVSSTTGVAISNANSNVQELKKLFLFVDYGDVKYRVDEFVVGGVTLDFDLQGIATLAWTGQGKALTEVTNAQLPQLGFFTQVPSYAQFIKNKLSTIELSGNYNRTPGYKDVVISGTGISEATIITLTNGTLYTVDVTVNGILQTVTYVGMASQSLGQILASINDQLGGAVVIPSYAMGTVTWRFQSELYGTGSTIAVADGATNGLFAAIDADIDVTTINLAIAPVDGVSASRSYVIPITGGSISLSNNLTFLTPEELGVVNRSIGHFTGTRNWSGSLTAYLKTGMNESSTLLKDLLNATTDTTISLSLTVNVGGTQVGSPRVSFVMPKAHLNIPTIDTQDVISTTIDFAAIPSDLGLGDDITINYVAGNQ